MLSSLWIFQGGGEIKSSSVGGIGEKNQLKLPKWLNCLEILLSEVSNTLEQRRIEEQGLFKVAGIITLGVKIVQAV